MMHISKINYYQRRNYCRYRSDKSRPRGWHKAVASHSAYGSRNPNALSRYIPGEDIMYHNHRKSFILPCGRSVGESWAALRKAWLGFKVAFSNDDTGLMTHYATFITKVQREMGIQVTHFDPAILDVEAIDEIPQRRFYKKQPETGVRLEEKSLDYDSVMEKARTLTKTKSLNIAPPRPNIFNRPKDSCWNSLQEKKDYSQQKIVTRTRSTKIDEKEVVVGVDPDYYEDLGSGNEPQSQNEDGSWDTGDDEMDEKEVVVGVDPDY